ncbi:MAG: hypothetical protein ACUVTL_10115 [Thermoproteota archaeon]
MNAKLLATGLKKLEGISVDPDSVETNIIIIGVQVQGLDSKQLVQRLDERGVKALSIDKNRIRLVTHRGVEREDIEYALEVFKEILDSLK